MAGYSFGQTFGGKVDKALAFIALNAYIVGMAVLNIRNLPDEVHAQLRVRAAKAGRSMEAEARAILTAVCQSGAGKTPPETLQDMVREFYGPNRPRSVVEEFIAERRAEAAREDAES